MFVLPLLAALVPVVFVTVKRFRIVNNGMRLLACPDGIFLRKLLRRGVMAVMMER